MCSFKDRILIVIILIYRITNINCNIMTKFYTLLLAGACALSVSAQKTISEIPFKAPERSVRNIQLTEGRAESKKLIKAEEGEGEFPASLVGKTYVTLFNDWDIACNGQLTVAEGADGGIVLKNFAGGFDVNATYDSATGTITIPVNVTIGELSNGNLVTLYSLIDAGRFSRKDPIIGHVKGNGIEFELGVYCEAGNGGIVLMEGVVAIESNASLTVNKNKTNSATVPLYVTKTAKDLIEVVGVSNLMYGAYCPMNFTLDEANKVAVYTLGGVVDRQYTQSGYVSWYCGGVDNGSIADLTMNVATTDNSSTFTVDQLFLGYPNGSAYTGYTFSDIEVSIDFNVYTAEVTGHGPGIEIGLEDWTEIATATMIDGWITPVLKTNGTTFDDPKDYPITARIARHNENPNLLLVIDPYIYGTGFPMNDDNTRGYILIDVTDPDFVLVTPGVFCGVYNGEDPICCTNVEGFYIAQGANKSSIQQALADECPEWSTFKTDADGNSVISIPNCRFTFSNDMTRLRKWTGRADAMKATITFNESGSGVANIDADDASAPVEYFNLQGVKVAAPENGIFIRRQGDKVSKVVVK